MLGRRRALAGLALGLAACNADSTTMPDTPLVSAAVDRDIALSSGSACTSATLEPSYVLRALGVGVELAHSSIRFGLGRFNTDEEVDYVVAKLVSVVSKLREMSPLYEMVKDGVDLSKMQWTAH